mgnify:CR=1 FL=1
MEIVLYRTHDNVNRLILSKPAAEIMIDVFMFLSTLFIGADVFGVNIGVNLRLDQLFLVLAAFFMMLENKYRFTKNKWVITFLFVTFVSTIFAFNFARGVLFYFSIVYNFIFVFCLYESYVRYYGLKTFINLFRKTMYIQFIVVIIQSLLKIVFNVDLPFMPSYGNYMGIERFCLWFYEPSYFATYVSIWFSISLYMYLVAKKRNYFKDSIMAFAMIFISTSTSGFIAVILSSLIILFVWLKKDFTFKKIVVLLLIVSLTIIFMNVFKNVYDVFIARLFEGNLDAASGGRIQRWVETYNVFCKNVLFGVGPGNYGLYLNQEAGYVPSNVTLELLATVGLFSTILFYAINFSCIFIIFSKKYKNVLLIKAVCIALFVFVLILQINQGYLRLYHWMFLGVIQGAISGIKHKYEAKYNKRMCGYRYEH